MSSSIERLMITVGEVTYALAPMEHVDELKAAIIAELRAGGGFVDITVDDGQRISVLITPTSVITITARTVHLEFERADGQDREGWNPGAPIVYDGDTPYDII
ncbi:MULTISPECIES: hypothetical protein [Microbacterium]|uniref:hypothetical protein n=1 Tax=Microbacterium TaxID=33882 RepID=UPI0027D77524|nr:MULTISPECIES: hypothetical protein [Microbacterium]